MAEDLVSVIVPAYNAEKYLDACIKSIALQTYKNLEIIIINDGSTDLTGEKCSRWKEKDKRIQVACQENKGVSAARNAGITKSTGRWIAFVDSDDSIEENYIERLLGLAEKWGTDISCCRSDIQEPYIGNYEQCVESKRFLLSKCYRTALWYYLYKKELFDGILFPEGKLSEDVAVLYRVIYRAEKVAVTSDVLYNHAFRKGSLSSGEQRITQCDIDRIDILKEKASFFEMKGENELAKAAWRDYMANILVVYNDRQTSLEINRKSLLDIYREGFQKVRKNEMVTWKMRILFYVSYIFPGIWGKIVGR